MNMRGDRPGDDVSRSEPLVASVQDILSNMRRGWKREPEGFAVGTQRTGISTAYWAYDGEDVQEVSAAPDPTRHIITLAMSSWKTEMHLDGRSSGARLIPSGAAQVIIAGRTPRAVNWGSWSVLHIYLPCRLLEEILCETDGANDTRELELIDPCFTLDRRIQCLGNDLLSEIRSGLPLSRLRIDLLGQDLAIHLLRRWSNRSFPPSSTDKSAKGGLAPWQLHRVVKSMEEDLMADLSLADLSALTGLSTFHLCRAFRESTGLPPHRWRMQRRIERAREMLEGTDLPVTEIAARVGFDSSGFATAFRKAVGRSPSRYRRERRR